MTPTLRKLFGLSVGLIGGWLAVATLVVYPPLVASPVPAPAPSATVVPATEIAGTPAPASPSVVTPPAPVPLTPTFLPPAEEQFAVIGDFGTGNANAAAVATLVASWKPAYIVAVGDIYYSEAGGLDTGRYDNAVGRYYCAWLAGVTTSGKTCPKGKAVKNAFFPALGNHDLTDAVPAPDSYLQYFNLPGTGFKNSSGNERYYDFVQGQVHFFVLNSNPSEKDGTTVDSVQAAWLKKQLAASTARWKVVVDHHPPYSSDTSHGSETFIQWPFAQWGADAVLSGHSHTYERVERDGIVYFVNGLGGQRIYQFAPTPVEGSKARFATTFGAQLVHVTRDTMKFEFFDINGTLIDSFTLLKK